MAETVEFIAQFFITHVVSLIYIASLWSLQTIITITKRSKLSATDVEKPFYSTNAIFRQLVLTFSFNSISNGMNRIINRDYSSEFIIMLVLFLPAVASYFFIITIVIEEPDVIGVILAFASTLFDILLFRFFNQNIIRFKDEVDKITSQM